MENIYIGLDIGGMSLKVGLVDEKGNLLFKTSIKTEENLTKDSFKEKIEYLIDQSIENIDVKKYKLNGIGCGVPGTINNVTNTIVCAVNIGISDLSLDYLGAKYKVPFYISNDANVACLAEKLFGNAKGYSDVVLLTLGTGIGGGVVSNNALIEGYLGEGVELGHICLVVDGRECPCGRNGCYEQYASATALLRYTKEAMEENLDSKMWEYVKHDINNVNGLTSFECAKAGDETAIAVVDKFVKYLSEGILDMCNIFRPQVILLGGGVSNQGEYLTSKVDDYIKQRNYGYKNSPVVKIDTALLKNDAGIIGAASLAISKNI